MSNSEKNGTIEQVKGKGKRGLVKVVFGRTVFFLLFLLLQLAALVLLYHWLDERYRSYGYGAYTFIGAAFAVKILNEKQNSSFKMAWLVIVLLFPVFGAFFYVFVQLQLETKMMATRIRDTLARTGHYLAQDPAVLEEIKCTDPAGASLCRYLGETCGFPAYGRTQVTYYPLGEDFYAALLPKLREARRFIFLEYFIVARGEFWDSIEAILTERAAAGVEVRLLYDGMNQFSSLSYDYPKQLEEKGIHCRVFNPIRPAISTSQNNRDHRKILVIDGHTAFTGGLNLADEYINRRARFGHWKDNAVCLTGDAVRSFTVMFLQMWGVCCRKPEFSYEYEEFLEPAQDGALPEPEGRAGLSEQAENAGYAVPFCDSPLDDEPVGHQVYLDIIYRAREYLYITTPYLTLDDDMLTALTFAAKRGVNTVILLPHIPDKNYAFMLAHSYYEELLDAGVKIYEYLPGFVHAKTFVSDDEQAVVGSINMDFRSQYLNFESAVYLCGCPVIPKIREDIEETLTRSVRMTKDSYHMLPLWHRFAGRAMRLVAPLV